MAAYRDQKLYMYNPSMVSVFLGLVKLHFIFFRSGTIPPLSMLCFQSLCLRLALNQNINSLQNHLSSCDKGKSSGGVFGTSLEKYFRVCVKAKKRHEVDLLADVSWNELLMLFFAVNNQLICL